MGRLTTSTEAKGAVMRKLAAVVTALAAGGVLSVNPAVAQSADTTSFCAETVKLYGLFNNEPDERSKPSEVERFQTRVASQLEKMSASAPSEIAPSVQTLVPIVNDTTARDADPFENPDFVTAYNAINDYLKSSCGFESLDITMLDYSFEGIPKSLETGTVAVDLTNEGAEFHELLVFRIKTKDSLKKLLRLSEKEANKRIDQVGGGFAEPDASSVTFLELKKPGRYGAICAIPVGSTPEAEEGDGPPHFVEGMATAFKVTRA